MNKSKSCTIVIPIYNDFESLVVLSDWIKESAKFRTEFLIVDNGSTDRRIHAFLEEQEITYTTSLTNLGFGGAIIFAAERVSSDWIAWMPGNLKVDPRTLVSFLEEFHFSPNTFVKAKRINRGRIANVKTYLAGAIQSTILLRNMLDTGGTPTLCERSFLLSLKDPPKDIVFESFMLYAARHRRKNIVRPKFPYGQRVFGQSHWQKGFKSEITLMVKIVNNCLRWRKRTM
jgi:glycosyltransferase involved in cell wall biosynthesis